MGGIASDGKNPFVITGNTFSPTNWQGGQAVIRFQPGPIFSGSPADYWVPENWQSLDNVDADLGSSGPLLVDVPDATPSHLVVALGKDRNAYLINRDNLGGISAPIAVSQVASSHYPPGGRHLSDETEHLCRVPRQQRWQHGSIDFPHHPNHPPAIASGWNVNPAPAVAVLLLSPPLMARIT